MTKPKALFICHPPHFRSAYSLQTLERLGQLFEFEGRSWTPEEIQERPALLRGVEVIFGSWGMLKLSDDNLKEADSLKAIFYAAGAIKGFTPESFWERGIKISSAWRSNAIPVAEFSVAMIILGLKRVLPSLRDTAINHRWQKLPQLRGNYGSGVGLVSFGAIGRLVRKLLVPFGCPVSVYDPFLKPEIAKQEEVSMVSLEKLFANNPVVSVHTPWLKETEKLITGDLLRSMPEGGTFINTSRGAVVDESAMIEVLRERPDLSAVLDVVYPEPPSADSELYRLPNVFLTPHLAGSVGEEIARMGDSMAEEASRYLKGEPLQHEVTQAMVETMA
jgi:phosphoglycerate dehydrogenase-like enzyme